MSYQVHLAKENFKFSCTHFTILGPQTAERMHGHNYQVSVSLKIRGELDPKLGLAFDFNAVKPVIKQLCDTLDEYILIPQQSPYLQVTKTEQHYEVRFGQKSYSLPQDDVRILPLVNVTSEELAHYFCDRLIQSLPSQVSLSEVTIGVEETRGQSVSYTHFFDPSGT